ncbi:MAG: 2-oxoacid:acceptor oxidoreductase family protein [Deltaproteobacteria bacterium]|nr:2-oxoacid:acceptor oxidoreductase family protein [Deltaproteobacteria bacterium]
MMHEVIWHGRGGQGVVLAAQILAESAYIQGFRGVTSAPTFGPERRGAPLTASTRISDEPIRTVSQIERADIAVVLDPTVMGIVDIFGRLKEGGVVIINTPHTADELSINGCFTVATVDASGIARQQRLMVAGAPVVNTPMLGAFARATGLVALNCFEKGLKKKMPADRAVSNFAAVAAAYDRTVITPKEERD